MQNTDYYAVLAGKHGYQDSISYRRVLEVLMTPKQTELVANMPAAIDELAKMSGIEEEDVRREMKDLFLKGMILAQRG